MVVNSDDVCIGIDKNDNKLFEVYWFNNRPDYLEDGLFRIKKGDKVGYAIVNEGIIIEPQFRCANAFENGKAKVTKNCNSISDGEYTGVENDSSLFVDNTRKKIDQNY